MAGSRRQARERALGLLYEAEAKGCSPAQVLAGLPLAPDAYAVELVSGVEAEADRIDKLIAEHSVDWSVDRMPVIDRCVLRIGTYELLDQRGVPAGVAISEAVELVTQYSTEQSGRFVNGLLASVAAVVRGPEPKPGGEDPAAGGIVGT